MGNMLKKLISISFWFKPSCLSKMKELKYSCKRTLHCYKRAPLFNRRALGQSRKASWGWIPLIGICFWQFSFKLRKMFFSKRALLSIRWWMLHLSICTTFYFFSASILLCVMTSIYGFNHCDWLNSNTWCIFLVLILVWSKVSSFHNESYRFFFIKKVRH